MRTSNWGLRWIGMTLTAVALAVTSLGPAARGAQAQQDDASQVRELAERLLLPQSYAGISTPFGSELEAPSAELLVGRLPTDLALDVPVLPGGRLVGSVVRHGGTYSYAGGGTEVVIDAPGAVEDVARAYEQALQQRGWSAANYRMGGGGFQQPAAGRSVYLCRDSDSASLTLRVEAQAGRPGMADVRLALGSSNSPPCFTPSPAETIGPSYGPVTMRSPYASLPALYPPEGVRLIASTSMGGSSGGVSSEARAITAMSPIDLERAFSQQLTAGGWSRLDGGTAGSLAWSAWAVPDEPDYRGFLMVRGGLADGQHVLTLRIDQAEIDPENPYGRAGIYYGYGSSAPVYFSTPSTLPMPASPDSPPAGEE